MKTIDTIITFVFLGIQTVGMAAFYFYYTYKNKKAEKAYWEQAR